MSDPPAQPFPPAAPAGTLQPGPSSRTQHPAHVTVTTFNTWSLEMREAGAGELRAQFLSQFGHYTFMPQSNSAHQTEEWTTDVPDAGEGSSSHHDDRSAIRRHLTASPSTYRARPSHATSEEGLASALPPGTTRRNQRHGDAVGHSYGRAVHVSLTSWEKSGFHVCQTTRTSQDVDCPVSRLAVNCPAELS